MRYTMPIKELIEIKKLCKQADCRECPYKAKDENCAFVDSPYNWPIDDLLNTVQKEKLKSDRIKDFAIETTEAANDYYKNELFSEIDFTRRILRALIELLNSMEG